ncbi:MAG: MXAN_2562 family outer membrane beta-barrel protein [Myxococcota bacterium]
MLSQVLLSLLSAPTVLVGFEGTIYRPAVDTGLGGATPYADVFGTGRGPLLGGELGCAFPILPDLALTGTIELSHFGTSAYAFVDDSGGSTPASTGQRSGGKTSLDVTPLSVSLGLRFTSLATRLKVPLIPYAQLGLAHAWWLVGRGDGTEAASGGTWGLSLVGGLGLELLGLEPHASRMIGDEFGVRSVMLQASVRRLWLDGFGQRSQLPLSDTAWAFGLELGF